MNAFLTFLRALTPEQRAAVARAWNGRRRHTHGRYASMAAWACADCMVSVEARTEVRRAAVAAAGGDDEATWAAEGAATEIQAFEASESLRQGGAPVKGQLTSFFFLPMFGFETPADLMRAREAA